MDGCATPHLLNAERKTDSPIYHCLPVVKFRGAQPGHLAHHSCHHPQTPSSPHPSPNPAKQNGVNKQSPYYTLLVPLNPGRPLHCLIIPVPLETSVCCPWARTKQSRPQLPDKHTHMPCLMPLDPSPIHGLQLGLHCSCSLACVRHG